MLLIAYYVILGGLLAVAVGSFAVRTKLNQPLTAVAVDVVYASLAATVALIAISVVANLGSS